VLWVGSALLLLLVLPYMVPGIAGDTLGEWSELYADLFMLVFVTATLGWWRTRGAPKSVLIFRRILFGAYGVLLVQLVLLLTLPDDEWQTIEAALVYSYLCYYFLILTALAVQPHLASRGAARSWLRVVRPLGTLMLLFGLLMYFVGIPTLYKWDLGHEGWLPTIALYFVLDLAIVGAAYRARSATESPGWRSVYGWLLLAFGVGTVADLVDLTMRAELIPWVEPGTPLDLLWFAPYPPLILAMRGLVAVPGSEEPVASPSPETELLHVFGSLRWLAYALSIPVLHLVLEKLHATDPVLESAREGLVLIYILSMGGVALAFEKLLRNKNRRLERDQAVAREQLHAARRMEGIGRLAAGIAHEFNNKLTVMNGSSELLHAKLAPGDPLRELTADIIQTGERAAELVSQLLAFSRKQVHRPRVLDLNRELDRLLGLLDPMLGASIAIRRVLAGDLPPVKIDPTHVEQVILNLATNARDAMAEGGLITVSTTSPSPERVLLTFSDNGSGMSEDARAKAFEPFFTTKPVGKGTGLGLATAFGLVEQNGGRIELESAPGKGTTFRIHLPASSRPVEPPGANGALGDAGIVEIG
jgi:signal transduction histidine kinase